MTRKPKRREDRFDFVAQACQRMTMSDRRPPSRKRDVDGVGRPSRLQRRVDTAVETSLDLLFELVGELPEPRAILGRRRPERLQQRRHQPAFAREEAVAHVPELGLGGRGCQRAVEIRPQRVDVTGRIGHSVTTQEAEILANRREPYATRNENTVPVAM